MLAVSCFFLHAIMIQSLHLLKVLCLSFARRRPSYVTDPHISDHVVITKVASITLLNRWITYKQYSSNAFKFEVQDAKWPSRLDKLVSIQIQVVSLSLTRPSTPRPPISSAEHILIPEPLISKRQSIAALFIAPLQWLDRRKNGLSGIDVSNSGTAASINA